MSASDLTKLGFFGLITMIISSIVVNSLWSSPLGQAVFGTNPNGYLAAWAALEAVLLLILEIFDRIFGLVTAFLEWLGVI